MFLEIIMKNDTPVRAYATPTVAPGQFSIERCRFNERLFSEEG
jgi:hypothetical protein